MYTLYYYNEALNVSTIEVETLDQPIRCPENLFFIALRKGKTFITEPAECIAFSALERLYIRSFGLSSFAFKNEKSTNFRLQNSTLGASCAEGEDGSEEKCPCNCNDGGGGGGGEPQIPDTTWSYPTFIGERLCENRLISISNKIDSVSHIGSAVAVYFDVGTVLLNVQDYTPISDCFIYVPQLGKYFQVVNSVITEAYSEDTVCGPELIELYIEGGQFRHHLNGYQEYKDNEEIILMFSDTSTEGAGDAHKDWYLSYSALTIGSYSSEHEGNADTVRLITDYGEYGTLNDFTRNTGTFYFKDIHGNVISNVLVV